MHLASAIDRAQANQCCYVPDVWPAGLYAAVLQLIEQSAYSSQPRLQLLKEKQ
jgi:hypothetical protein